jgi:hypothetical protein
MIAAGTQAKLVKVAKSDKKFTAYLVGARTVYATLLSSLPNDVAHDYNSSRLILKKLY